MLRVAPIARFSKTRSATPFMIDDDARLRSVSRWCLLHRQLRMTTGQYQGRLQRPDTTPGFTLLWQVRRNLAPGILLAALAFMQPADFANFFGRHHPECADRNRFAVCLADRRNCGPEPVRACLPRRLARSAHTVAHPRGRAPALGPCFAPLQLRPVRWPTEYSAIER